MPLISFGSSVLLHTLVKPSVSDGDDEVAEHNQHGHEELAPTIRLRLTGRFTYEGAFTEATSLRRANLAPYQARVNLAFPPWKPNPSDMGCNHEMLVTPNHGRGLGATAQWPR